MVIVGRFNAQVSKSVMHSFELRRFIFDAEWDQMIETAETYVRTMDKLLSSFFFDGLFTENNVKRRYENLKNGARSALSKFGAYSDRLRSSLQFSIKLDIVLLDSIEKILKFNWDSLYVSADCDAFLDLIKQNGGHDLPIVKLEEITQVTLFSTIIFQFFLHVRIYYLYQYDFSL